jgi:hypothetical protein
MIYLGAKTHEQARHGCQATAVHTTANNVGASAFSISKCAATTGGDAKISPAFVGYEEFSA